MGLLGTGARAGCGAAHPATAPVIASHSKTRPPEAEDGKGSGKSATVIVGRKDWPATLGASRTWHSKAKSSPVQDRWPARPADQAVNSAPPNSTIVGSAPRKSLWRTQVGRTRK